MAQAGVARREAWLDALRGFACLLVVYNHVVGFSPMFGVPVSGLWIHAIRLFDTFRMPVFFFVAGVLAAGVVSRTWIELVRHRVLSLIWVYLVWAALQAGVPELMQARFAAEDWRQAMWALVWPHQNLWFLWALALYLLIARTIRSLPLGLQLSVGVALALAAQVGVIGSPDNPAVAKVAQYFVYFVIAIHLRRPVVEMPRPGARAVVGWSVAFVLAAEVWIRAGGTLGPLFPLVTSSLAIVAGLTLARSLGEVRVLRPMQYLGRRTLPVYCVHFLPAIYLPIALQDLIQDSAFRTLWPAVATAAALAIALVTYASLRRATWLWQAPEWLSAGAQSRPVSGASSGPAAPDRAVAEPAPEARIRDPSM